MKYLLSILILVVSLSPGQSQVLDMDRLDTLPEGIYSTYMNYRNGVPTQNMALEKKFINRRAKRDKWLNICFFHFKVNDQQIAAPFMIKKEGDIYLSTAYVRSNQDEDGKVKLDLGPDRSYIKIIEKGRYWFLEGRRASRDYIASSFGLAGALLSTNIEKDYREPVGIIYESSRGVFTLINTCEELEAYTARHSTNVSMDCTEKYVTPWEVQYYVELANQNTN